MHGIMLDHSLLCEEAVLYSPVIIVQDNDSMISNSLLYVEIVLYRYVIVVQGMI